MNAFEEILSRGQTLSTFHYTLLDKCRALLSVVERGWPNALDFSLDLELNIPWMYYVMNNSFMECFVHYLLNSNCICVRSTTLDNARQRSTILRLPKLHSRQKTELSTSLNKVAKRSRHFTQHVCRVKCRERLATYIS